MKNIAAGETGSVQASPYRSRRSRKVYDLDRWMIPTGYIRSEFGDAAADIYERRREKELGLTDVQLHELLIIEEDGFSEEATDLIMSLTDEQQTRIASTADRLKALMRITYPARAGKWLESPVVVLDHRSPIEVLISEDAESNGKLQDILAFLERCLPDQPGMDITNLELSELERMLDFSDGSLGRPRRDLFSLSSVEREY